MFSPDTKRSLPITLISAVIGATLAVGVFFGVKRWYPSTLRHGQRAVTPRGELSVEERGTIDLFQVASSSVVYITSVAVERDAFSTNVFEIPQGAGSGFIWDQRGYIVTNFHVIQNAAAARITLSDHSSWEAKLVGVEPDKDIAVLKIDPAGSSPRTSALDRGSTLSETRLDSTTPLPPVSSVGLVERSNPLPIVRFRESFKPTPRLILGTLEAPFSTAQEG
jgi:S1-C subfamily serine protease